MEISNNNFSSPRINKFEEWTSGDKNYNKFLNEEKVEDFQMFEFEGSSYIGDLKDFSQEWIDKYDADEDKNLNYNEFVSLANDGQIEADTLSTADKMYNDLQEENGSSYDKDGDKGISFKEFLDSENLMTKEGFSFKKFFKKAKDFNAMNQTKEMGLKKEVLDSNELKAYSDLNKEMQKQFETFNFDGNKDSINASEVASVLYSSDLDIEHYNNNDGEVVVDGKLNYMEYQTQPMKEQGTEDYKNQQFIRQDFYNTFYADKE